MIENNICLMTDSYKITHHHFYPKGTEKLYSYMESRIGAEYNKTVFFGLQYILKKYLTGNIVTEDKIDEDLIVKDGNIFYMNMMEDYQ